MSQWLRSLKVDRVALVDTGANPKADIVLFKRDSTVDKGEPDSTSVHVNGSTAGTFIKPKRQVWPPVKKGFPAGPPPTAVPAQPTATAPAAPAPKPKPASPTVNSTMSCPDCDTSMKTGGTCPGCGYTATAKRSYTAEERKAMAAKGQALPDLSFPIKDSTDLSNAVSDYGRTKDKTKVKAHIMARAKALGATGSLPEDWTVSKREEEKMDQIDKAALNEEQLAYVEGVEAKLAETQTALEVATKAAETPTPDPVDAEAEVFKSLPVEFRKRYEELEKRAADAEEIAKAERETRENAEAVAKAQAWAPTGIDAEKFGPVFRKFAKADAEGAAELERVLSAVTEQVRESNLFAELGKAGYGADGGDALDKLNKMAAERFAKGDYKTDAEAFDAVLQTKDGQKLYDEYSNGGVK